MGDSIKIETMFLKEIIARIIKHQLKTNLGLELSGLNLEELDISHADDGRICLSLGIKAAINEKQLADLLMKKNLMEKEV